MLLVLLLLFQCYYGLTQVIDQLLLVLNLDSQWRDFFGNALVYVCMHCTLQFGFHISDQLVLHLFLHCYNKHVRK